ncbi:MULTISPECIES: restriction endonuclease subunit S [Bacillaceae]|uniref:restriction endonuclease subunit S n=1 Tax=Bacillaceae TaxID=186817 RepID=UPI002963D747|nr:restriction endonuclease subunit S [Bacillus infantis]MDW2879550.1 restriction endonuclease subunit S [Bacillus infantis]
MTSIYKRIGDCIRLVDERNDNLRVKTLLGLSITKEFIQSVANIVGTDLKNYKIIRKNQFACSTMQVRRDKKMPVALLKDYDEAIISAAYPVFEVIDEEIILPEYLMMWFSRSEFDREACFYAIGGVRGSIEWDDFCDMKLPVPSIDKQMEIVNEYMVLVDRIELNNRLIEKLEESAKSIFKQWFVDFEFPDEDGNPYKSNGGELEYNDVLEKDIPKGWEVGVLEDIVEIIISHRGKSKSIMDLRDKDGEFIYPVISAMNVSNGAIVKQEMISYVNKKTYKDWMRSPLEIGDVIMTSEAPMGELLYVANRKDYVLSQRLYGIRVNRNLSRGLFLYFWLCTTEAKKDMEGRATGTTVLGIKLSELKKLIILKPTPEIIFEFENKVHLIMEFVEEKRLENELINDLKNILLSKLISVEG